jgi:diguanylate cyclase (GGDEF)-like protein
MQSLKFAPSAEGIHAHPSLFEIGGWGLFALLVLLYFIAGVAGLSVHTAYDGITPIWPPSGIAFAFLFLFGIRLWPAIVIAMLGLSLFADIPIAVGLAAGLGSVLEAVIPILILRRLGFDGNLNRLQNVLYFVGIAVLIGPMFSSTIGSAAFAVWQSLKLDAFIRMWAFWWLGNSIGILMIGSSLLIWSATPKQGELGGGGSLLLLVLLTVAASYASVAIDTFPISTLSLYFLFPLIVFAAMQYSARWVSVVYLTALMTFILSGVLLFPERFQVAEIGEIYLNISFLSVFTFLGLFASAAHTEQLENRLLEYKATTDFLTGLRNRHAFLDELNHMLNHLRRSEDRHSLLFIDLDGFKAINDSAGHATGDQVLNALGQVIGQVVRGQDIAARLGGDEFAILLRNCGAYHALLIAEKVRSAVSNCSVSINGFDYSVTASIGIVRIENPCHNVTMLMELADQACYSSKRAGGDRVTMAEGLADFATHHSLRS